MNFKHVHDWKLQNTFCGGGTNGSVKICECGARRMIGVMTRAEVIEGDAYFHHKAIDRYARPCESLVLENNPREERRQERRR